MRTHTHTHQGVKQARVFYAVFGGRLYLEVKSNLTFRTSECKQRIADGCTVDLAFPRAFALDLTPSALHKEFVYFLACKPHNLSSNHLALKGWDCVRVQTNKRLNDLFSPLVKYCRATFLFLLRFKAYCPERSIAQFAI